MIPVDVLTVIAPGETVAPEVLEALGRQGSVAIRHHLVEGPRAPGEDRVQAIARARNRAKTYGDAHYAMFLDRDVVLPPGGIESLVLALALSPHHAALAICYQDDPPIWSGHIAMGSMLFVRPILEQIHFRADEDFCECFWCCEDLRRLGYRVDYLLGLRARHLSTG